MVDRLRLSWASPAARGFIMLAVMQLAYGFANSATNSTVTNFFAEVLHFSGPQFGYMTAIRELGGLTLILLMALLYRVSLQWLTAGAMFFLGVGYALHGVASNFVTLIPWILMSSFGLHTVLQTQYSLGMSLTTQEKSGRVLGRMNAYARWARSWLSSWSSCVPVHSAVYVPTFIIMGVAGVVGAIAIVRFPNLHEGQPRKVLPQRQRIVWRRDYHYFYWMNLLDGVRQQIFFSFGLWVLVNRFGLAVAQVSLLLMIVTFVAILSSSYLGRLIDRLGERAFLQAINIGYVVALAAMHWRVDVNLACFFLRVYFVHRPISRVLELRPTCAR
jgi:predicted MFS family arabinose efflux permease